jgi:hypothetical protein
MNEDWAVMYISLKFDRKGRQIISENGGKTWKKGSEGRAESIGNKSLCRLIASGAETIKTSNGEIYTKELDIARLVLDKTPERFIRYLRINPPSTGYEATS